MIHNFETEHDYENIYNKLVPHIAPIVLYMSYYSFKDGELVLPSRESQMSGFCCQQTSNKGK